MTLAPRNPEESARFLTTRWSLVSAAQDEARARDALGELAQAYSYPLYAYVRRLGVAAHEAEDVVQGFFAHLLERPGLGGALPGRGRFRSYIRAAVRHYVSNQRDHERAEKRGGGRVRLAIDLSDAEARHVAEARDNERPELAFDRLWARELLAASLRALADEYAASGQRMVFETLRPHLQSPAAHGDYARDAEILGLAESAVRVAVHRLRQRFRTHLEGCITETLADIGDLPAEIEALGAALAGLDPEEFRSEP